MPRCATGNHFAKKVGDKNCSACLKNAKKEKFIPKENLQPKTLTVPKKTKKSEEKSGIGESFQKVTSQRTATHFLPLHNVKHKKEVLEKIPEGFFPNKNEVVVEVEQVDFGLEYVEETGETLIPIEISDDRLPRDYSFYSTDEVELLNGVDVVKEAGSEAYYWINREGYLHREDGKPAHIYYHGGKTIFTWAEKGKKHNLKGPALANEIVNREIWSVRGVESENADECRKAVSPETPTEELYPLCIHKDPVVRELAINNPNCPDGFKVASRIVKK